MSTQDLNSKITNTEKFKDEFGKYSQNYSSCRPLYPDSLYQLIDNTVDKSKRQLAVDVGCGSGQNSIRLASLFDKVVAFDPSEGQITNALKHDKVEYHVGSAEKIELPDGCADLITVATALHWFNLPVFFKEAERVLKSGGYFIGFTYDVQDISNNEEANKINKELSSVTLGPYWNQTTRKLVMNGYADITPPFKDTKRTSLKFYTKVSIGSLIGHYSSWSAYSTYVKSNPDPLPQIKEKILQAYQTTDETSPLVECEYTVSIIISKKD